MAQISAGILVFRRRGHHLEVLLGRLGGPLWAKRAHWTIPKGIVEDGEDQLAAAYREFEEETGWAPPDGEPRQLGEVRQASGKRVVAWALEGDYDPATMVPGTFQMEWPPRSGRIGEFPELSEVRWFSIDAAGSTIASAQVPLLDRLRAGL
jgi:predicted NUDIX family NTP pyrophosphohydrolase